MNSKADGAEVRRTQRRVAAEVKTSLRALSNQIAILNHQVGSRLDLRDVDLDCLDLLSRGGPTTPGALARTAGLHPATMTGVLDRLERAGWLVRERGDGDRRVVIVRALGERAGEIFAQYSGMNSRLDEICDGYSVAELTVIAEFLAQSTDAGTAATEEFAAQP